MKNDKDFSMPIMCIPVCSDQLKVRKSFSIGKCEAREDRMEDALSVGGTLLPRIRKQ